MTNSTAQDSIIGMTFLRGGYPFRVMREYMPGVYEARGASGEVVVPVEEIIG
jgi:hypothetical protein